MSVQKKIETITTTTETHAEIEIERANGIYEKEERERVKKVCEWLQAAECGY